MTSRTDNDTNHARILLEGFPADLRDAVHEISRRHPHLDLHTTANNSADYDLTLICGDVANQSSVSITAVLKDSALEQLVSIENGDLRQTSRVRLLGEHLVELVNTLLGSVNDSQKLFNEGRSLEDLIHSLATQSSDGNEYLGLMLINIDWPGTESAESSDPLLSDLSAILKQRIGTAIRRYDHVLQTAAGQFAVILRNQQGYPTATADSLVKKLGAPIGIDQDNYQITPSLGMSEFPSESSTPAELIQHASLALSRARERGGNCYQSYDALMSSHLSKRWSQEEKLRRALDNQEFTLNYHPIVEVKTGQIFGVEALLRWDDPDHGRIFPDQFIPVLEDTSMIIPVGEWVLYEACHQAAQWQDEYQRSIMLHVNLSPRQLDDPSFLNKLATIIKSSGLHPGQLHLEITENVLLGHTAIVLETLTGIGELGVHLFIDDFGTGFSSMGYLKRLPITGLKIDKSFIDGVPEDASDKAITLSIMELAKNMNLAVIPEGVETASQLAFLAAQGAETVQGFYFSKPLPAAHLGKLLESHARLPTTLPPLVQQNRLHPSNH